MASPTRLTASTSVNSATEAPARFHQMIGVRESSLRAWSIIWPQLPSRPMPSQDRIASDSTSAENVSTKVMTIRWAMLGRMWRRMMRPSRHAERARRRHVVELAQLQRLAARDAAEVHPAGDAERHAHLQRALAQRHDQRDQQQQGRHRRQHRHDEEHGVVDAAAEVAGRHAEQQRDRDHDQAGQAADQQRDAHALQRAIDHVAAEDVGAEQVRARMRSGCAAVELDARERRRVARLVEVSGGKMRSMTVRGLSEVSAIASLAPPTQAIESSSADEQVDGDHHERQPPPAPQLDGVSRQKRSRAARRAPAHTAPPISSTTTMLETQCTARLLTVSSRALCPGSSHPHDAGAS